MSLKKTPTFFLLSHFVICRILVPILKLVISWPQASRPPNITSSLNILQSKKGRIRAKNIFSSCDYIFTQRGRSGLEAPQRSPSSSKTAPILNMQRRTAWLWLNEGSGDPIPWGTQPPEQNQMLQQEKTRNRWMLGKKGRVCHRSLSSSQTA